MGSFFHLFCAFVVLASLGRGMPLQRGGPAPSRFELVANAAEWPDLCRRGERASFGARSGALALAELERKNPGPEARAIALLALGASGSVAERERMRDLARTGSSLEQRAALLALGLVGTLDGTTLGVALASGPSPVAECALLGLLLSGSDAARRQVEALGEDRDNRLSASARDLLTFSVDCAASTPGRASSLYLRLRWEAARRFGLIDGEAWIVLRLNELAADRGFMREVVLRGAARLDMSGIGDHLLPVLRNGQDVARLHATVTAMPRELAELVKNGLWVPATPVEWAVLIEAIEKSRLERLTKEILHAALEVPELRFRALALLGFAGEEEAAGLLDLDLALLDTEDRIELCSTIGSLRDEGWLLRFESLRDSETARVRLAFQVAALRCGNKKAAQTVAKALGDDEHQDHVLLVDILCRLSRDPLIAGLLDGRLAASEADERLKIATTLCFEGRIAGRTAVVEALRADPPPTGGRALRLVRALGRESSPEDGPVLRRLFPSDEDLGLNIELALGLLELRDPIVLRILRAALWQSDWDESCLAAALLVHHGGARLLRELLTTPPSSASSNDLRRVGFALGEWGGASEVEALQRDLRFSSGHPALQGALLGILTARTR